LLSGFIFVTSKTPAPIAAGAPLAHSQLATTAASATQPRLVESYGKLPLSFEINKGQTNSQVKFLSRGRGYSLFLTGNEAVLSLRKSGVRIKKSVGPTFRPARSGPTALHQHQRGANLFSKSAVFPAPLLPTTEQFKDGFAPREEAQNPDAESQAPAVLHMKLVAANPNPKVSGLEELPGKSNYFIGNDTKKWRTNVVNYAKVKYADVYPGVDLVYYGKQGRLEYDFVVSPGADPAAITLELQTGESKIQNPESKIDKDGDLVVGTDDGGEVIFYKPVIYQPPTYNELQTTNGSGHDLVGGRYVLRGDNRIAFQLADYDRRRPVVIDPVLTYSTYLGGSGRDSGSGVTVDRWGNAYITGGTDSSDFPTTSSPFQINFGGGYSDAFVSKLNPTGSALVYSTYLGGSNDDGGSGIAVDTAGNAYVTGSTASSDFPTTPGAYQNPRNQGSFITKLNAAGSALVYSTSSIGGVAMAVDALGNVYVTGETRSTNFPTTAGALQTRFGGPVTRCSSWPCGDGFVSKLNPSGSALAYSTYLGGSKGDGASGIAVDVSGSAYVTGTTYSSNFPTTAGAYQSTYAGGDYCSDYQDLYGACNIAFVTKLNPTGSALLYSTYLGGSPQYYGPGWTGGAGIVVDSSGNAYVTGSTESADFPITPGAVSSGSGAGSCWDYYYFWALSSDAFITKLNPVGSALVYSATLGGICKNGGSSIGVDASGNAVVVGGTDSITFPVTQGAFQTTYASCQDHYGCSTGFVSKLNASGSFLAYSTYFPAFSRVAVASSGTVYLTGSAGADFPTTAGALQTTYSGGGDAFVSKLDLGQPQISLTPTSFSFPDQAVGTVGSAQQATLRNVGGAPLKIASIGWSGDFYEGNNCPTTLAAGGASCRLTVKFTPTLTGARSGGVTIADNAPGSPHRLSLSGTGTGTGSIILTLSPPTGLSFGSVAVGTASSTQMVTVKNIGTTAASFLDPFGFATAGTNWSDFHKNPWRCGTSLAPGASCQISVYFKPLATGTRTGYFLVRQGAASVQIPLSGTGL
jgi:hypothetical protein